ncbi:MAG: hypothetical protein EWV61_15880 [Microcystis aeruginosa Ma_AC_P_19900807_S300]|nr:MAG: hypothetical protein EWV61_15880 [Microcystis aeruginosa Ma_AC_P_19900807_S300]
MLKKFVGGGRVWGVGCGVWGFTDFEVVSYLIFREKVPEFYPRSLQWSALSLRELRAADSFRLYPKIRD